MKVKERFWSCFSLLIYVSFFGHCHVTIPYKEILSFFVHCHVTFPYMYVFLILGNSLCNSKVCCFHIQFVTSYRNRKELQWKGACVREVSCQPLSYKQSLFLTPKFRKKVSSFLQLRIKNTLFIKTTAPPITTKRRVLYPLVNITLYHLEMFKSF